ncbi:hypothetical protein J8J14_16535 [Roseomonas sp. SSH11]|uniref:Uncharacterized protein n=1 Tax=Pararoseomonas baculiformis TaxID=2820812 RepID=A0ABS4AH86_9PROT|nr:hypothetical protein [Pararoseomonas baculiformis]MBP0446383.1 hypothetical protein [Pararoseomonas baculiformis]
MDFHFLIRNGIAGGIFLALAFAGMWATSPDDAARVFGALTDVQSLVVALVAAATPVIGICLQSLVLIFRYTRRDMFTDDARRLVARRFREAIHSDANWRSTFGDLLDSGVDDRVFVSIYHRTAPQHLIEWARRRRSYNYLGETCACAVVIGFTIGLFIPDLINAGIWGSERARILFVIIPGVIWTIASLWLARKMRQDADRMELAWAIHELVPDLGRKMKVGGFEARRVQAPVPRLVRDLLLVAGAVFLIRR